MRWLAILALALTLAGCRDRDRARGAARRASSGAHAAPRKEGDPIYDDQADAEGEVADAIAEAKGARKRVLIVLGANWCPWCRRLDATLAGDPEVSSRLAAAFVVVHVSTGDRGSDVNAELVRRYLPGSSLSLPFLIVLDGEGQVVARQQTGPLEDGDHHDPARIAAFLDGVRGS